MKRRNLILTTVLAGSLAAAGFATVSYAGTYCKDHHGAHAGYMNNGEGRHDPLQRIMRHIDLSAAQQTEIKAIIDTSRENTKPIREQLRDNREALQDLVTSENYSVDQVRALADQQATLRAELTVARIDSYHSVLQLLTPEQQAKLVVLRKEREDKMHWRKES